GRLPPALSTSGMLRQGLIGHAEDQLQCAIDLDCFGVNSVDLQQQIRIEYLLGTAGRDDATAIEHYQFGAVAGGQVQVVQHDDGGCSQAPEHAQQFVLIADIQVVGGLIEQQVIGLLD